KPAVSGQKAENKTGKDKTTVSGKTTPGAKVTISKDGQKVGEVTAENDGSFTVDIDKQTPNTTLTLTPSKNGVNGDPVTTTVTGETPAEKPAVSGQKAENKTGKDKTTVSGKTTPGAKVTISKDGQKVGEVTAENDGSFTVDIDKQTPNTTLTLTPSKNGVNGDPVTTTVTGETPAEKPAAPTVTPQNDGSVDVTPADGTDTLEITYTPEGETNPKTITVKKGNDGKWKGENTPEGVKVDENTGKVTIPADKVKDNSDVKAKDKKGNNTSSEATGKAGTNDGNSGSGSETGNSNSSESGSGNDSTSNNGGSDSGSTTGGSSSTDSGAQNSTNESSSTDNANNAGNAETGNAGNGKAGNASTGASGSNASTKSGNKVPAKHSSQLVETGAEVERVGLISAMIAVLGAAAAFFSRKKNRE
ncbi:Ig-like domain-containing protein, partial [Gardnerella vaginalis]|uniref:Ig-like domain-containing protein n=1 Tax=Gardnerella vaginalis TaxID=2702 RepID=UPI0039710AD2